MTEAPAQNPQEKEADDPAKDVGEMIDVVEEKVALEDVIEMTVETVIDETARRATGETPAGALQGSRPRGTARRGRRGSPTSATRRATRRPPARRTT